MEDEDSSDQQITEELYDKKPVVHSVSLLRNNVFVGSL